jgi:hypothetical protein
MVDKLLLAMRGNLEARNMLIRNPNKIIQEAVLDNPRISAREVLELAKERTTGQTVIEKIANNREWTRSLEVTRALCWNPKTPARFIFHALPLLGRKDLRRLAASKNVAGFTRQQARGLLARREAQE